MIKNILIFPSGADNSIELYDSLRFSPHFDVYGATSQKDRSDLIYPHGHLLHLPFIYEGDFIEELNKVISRHKIDMVFATHDTVLLELVRKRADINAAVIGCDLQTAKCCRYKDRLYQLFAKEDFLPKWSKSTQVSFPPPYFLKPIASQGALGCLLLDECPSILPDEYILSEYLPGMEYTVDCFTDRHGKLLFIGPRSRDIVKMGIAFKSRPVYSPEIDRIAEILNNRLNFRGLWFFQVKEDGQGNPKLLEISSRVSTTMGLTRQRGVNLPLLSAYDAMDRDVRVIRQNFNIENERVLRNIYRTDLRYSKIYVDYDDTLVVQGHVNEELIKFLYQSLNVGKEVILLTRHEGDILAELSAMRICKDIFAQIIHLPPEGDKIALLEPDSIYIDNMFHDREKAAALGIPVFDVDTVAGLACSRPNQPDNGIKMRHIRCDLLVPVDPVKELVNKYCDEKSKKKLEAILNRMKETFATKGYRL